MDYFSVTGDGAPSTAQRLVPVALFFAVAPNVTLETCT